METFDVLVVGGGPAGSTAARFLTAGGARVAIIDRATFPRVKLCGGWLSTPIWDELGIAASEYPARLWPWETCHVSYLGEERAIRCRGWFIRRFELDDYLLRRSGAVVHQAQVKAPERQGGMWTIGDLRARYLIGAGGTHCPVARVLEPTRPRRAVGAQENEFQADPQAIARTRIGKDGEPELLLHDDLRGYSWNVSKTDWLNVGSGTADPTEVRAMWSKARDHFRPHVPVESAAELDSVKGHSYFLFDPIHIDGAARDDAFLVGDSLGLAHPLTAEGILPSVVSGRVAAEAILTGANYVSRLRAHPVIADYTRVFRIREAIASFRSTGNETSFAAAGDAVARSGSRMSRVAIARAFAWMFSGARMPAPRLIDLALSGAERWLDRRST